jgi:histidinol-phosphatase (PHP family)
MIDYHLHTRFSPDGRQTLDEMCRAARAAGIGQVAVTDHVDSPDPRFVGTIFTIANPQAYIESIDEARRRYPDIMIVRGLELGYTPSGWEEALRLCERIRPEFVIGSLHLAEGLDPYEARYFEGVTRQEAYRRYLVALRDAVPHMAGVCDTLGHLTYVTKFTPYEDGALDWDDEPELIDAILHAALAAGLALEINTSGYRRLGAPLPGLSIVRRFRELGGEFVTLGSDAHGAAHVGHRIRDAAQLARQAGMRYMLVVRENGPTPIPLP